MRLDHITVTAPSLEVGSDYVFSRLGVRPPAGGEHPRMGTHNLLLRLGEDRFLEVIAPNPRVAKPARPRWFELDDLSPGTPPRLRCWVAGTDDIRGSLASASEPLGVAEPMTRGTLEWLISIPEDGRLPLGGAAPALIEWPAGPHPASRMQDLGCSLSAFMIRHPDPDRVAKLLLSLGLDDASITVIRANEASLEARIETPSGLLTLAS